MFVDGNMFVVGMTYQWKNEQARKAFATSVANDAIADFIGDRPFKVIAFEKIASDIECVSVIEIDGKTYTWRDVNAVNEYAYNWFLQSEERYFKVVSAELTTDAMMEQFFNNYEVSVRRYGEEEVFKIDDYNQFKRVFATKLQRDFEREKRIKELEEELERLKAEK